MRNLTVIHQLLLPLFLLAAIPRIAFAQDAAPPAPPVAAPPPPPGAVLVPIQREAAEDYKHFSIVANPLAISIGRYSVQGEYLPALHHALTLNPFYTSVSISGTADGVKFDEGSFSGFGAELGYRYYSGSKGPNGFFAGPSILLADYSQSGGGGSFSSIGGAIDIGGQGVVGPGIVIGGGFGLQWTKNSKDYETGGLNLASAVIAGGGTRPRALFHIGYAF